jgi:tRNA (guanine-N7-)-methyltransferase
MGKNKFKRFQENNTFPILFQPEFEEVFAKDFMLKGRWNDQVFKNNHPIVLELGCGRGEYTVGLAKQFPEKNFIGVDSKGARLWRGAKTVVEEQMNNAAFIRTKIDFITSFFASEEVSEIWITFSDPQPKRPRKRLSSPAFIQRYVQFLHPDGVIHLKTDSLELHQFTRDMVKLNGMEIIEVNEDIYGSGRADEMLSIETAYESKFKAKGKLITYLSFRPNGIVPKLYPDEIYFHKEL